MCKPGEKCETPCPNCTCRKGVMVIGHHDRDTRIDPEVLRSMQAQAHLVVLEHPSRVLIGCAVFDEEKAKRALEAIIIPMEDPSSGGRIDTSSGGKPDPRRMGRRQRAELRRRVRNGK